MLRKSLAVSLSATIILSGCASNSSQPAPIGSVTPAPVLTPVTAPQVIKHVVVIFGENVSFDHYFGTYPNATNPSGEPTFTAAAGTPTPNNFVTEPTLLTANPNNTDSANGAAASNPFRLDYSQAATNDQDHNYGPEQMAFDNGVMDKFPLSVGVADTSSYGNSTTPAIARTNGLTMGYYDGNTVTALWNYAQHYAMNDNSFGTTFGPSTTGALNVVSGQTNGAVNDIGAASAVVADGGTGLSDIGDADPTGDLCSSTSESIHMTGRNVGDLLSAAKVTWGFFQGGFDLTATNADGSTGCGRTTTSAVTNTKKADYIPHHEPFQYYASTENLNHVRPTSVTAIGTNADAANHQYDTHDFFEALAAGNMPAVSFLKAPGYQDAHAGYSDPIDEQAFIVNTINTIEQSSFWANTAIIINYDDSDGWYDHVLNVVNGSKTLQDALTSAGVCSSSTASSTTALPGVDGINLHAQGRCGYGPRLPMMVISPWSNVNAIDHTVTDQSSITRFIEDTFLSSQRLGGGSFDSIAGPLTGMFNFTNNVAPNATPVLLSPTTGEVTSSK